MDPNMARLAQRWIALDDTLRTSRGMIREVTTERNTVATELMQSLQARGYTKPSLRLGGDTVVVTETRRRPPITVEAVRAAMAASGVAGEQIAAVVEHLQEERESNATATKTLVRKRSRRGQRTRRAASNRSQTPAHPT